MDCVQLFTIAYLHLLMSGCFTAAVALPSPVAVSSANTAAENRVVCPSYCACADESIKCANGYTFNSTSLHGTSASVTNISLHNFVIRELSTAYFAKFTQLKQLVLTECRIKVISGNSLNNLGALQYLNLESNHITELPSNVFATQENLTYLNLAHNLIAKLPDEVFYNITSVEMLLLGHNRLRLLPSNIFHQLVGLRYLDLSNNEISFILPSTFNFISHVQHINLTDNLLVTIHKDLFTTNNVTVLTKLSVAKNPLDCNCGMVWLKEALIANNSHIRLEGADSVICNSPEIYHQRKLADVPLEQLNCTKPTATVVDVSKDHFHANKAQLHCHITGSPTPSVVWKTPLLDYISDPYRGQWLDGTINKTYATKTYKIIATGELIEFAVKTHAGYSALHIDTLHLVSSGVFKCIAMNPGGRVISSINVTATSSVKTHFYPSLMIGAVTVAIAIVIGIVGCSVTACVEKCSCCPSMILLYYDGSWMNCRQMEDDSSQVDEADEAYKEMNANSSNAEPREVDELLGAGSASVCSSEPSTSSHPYPTEINEHTALTAEEWDEYFRQFPDDFVVESFNTSPKKMGSPHGSPRGSPTHRSQGKTLETLEGVRVRLKLRVEQIDVMRERLRVHMEKRSARMKENMERRKTKMNKRMQTIKETTSQSLQSIRETGRSYSHKLHMGVRSAMENVGAQVQSLKEFCGTGDLGQTVSIATITTDIDTNEKTEVTRSVTMV